MIDIAQIYSAFNDSHCDLKLVLMNPIFCAKEGIKVLKSKNFYNCVRLSIGATSLYQVEKTFCKKSNRGASDKWIDAKKWRNYERGYMMPSNKTVSDAEQISKKSFKHEVNMVLWNVLDTSSPINYRIRLLFRHLQPEDRKLARICDKLFHASGNQTVAIRQICSSLTANPSMDRLAIVTLFLRKSQEFGEYDQCCLFTIVTIKMLYILGAELSMRRIAADLYWFYSYHIFDLVNEDVEGLMIGAEIIQLLSFVTNTNDPSSSIDENESYARINQFLDGKHGTAFIETFLPKFHESKFDLNEDWDSEDISLCVSVFSILENCDLNHNLGFLNSLIQIFISRKIPRIFDPIYLDPDLNFKFFCLQACQKKPDDSQFNKVQWLGLKF